jgi:hypothetical protein
MTLLIFFFLNFSSHLFHSCAWHFFYFSLFSSTVVSFQICAWYLFPHCSYPSLFHWFNLFTIVCIYSLCKVLLLLALHNSVVSLPHFDAWNFSCIFFLNYTSLCFISWPSRYLLLNSTAYLFQIISAHNIPLTLCSSFCNCCI